MIFMIFTFRFPTKLSYHKQKLRLIVHYGTFLPIPLAELTHFRHHFLMLEQKIRKIKLTLIFPSNRQDIK